MMSKRLMNYAFLYTYSILAVLSILQYTSRTYLRENLSELLEFSLIWIHISVQLCKQPCCVWFIEIPFNHIL